MNIMPSAFFLLLCSSLAAQEATIRIPESREPVRIVLSQPVPQFGTFQSVIVRVGGHATTFRTRNGVACAPKDTDERKHDLDWSEIEGMQLDRSLCFHRAEYGSGEEKHTILAFIGHGGASDAGPAFLIGFKSDGMPYKVLERNELDISAFIPNDADGSVHIVGFPTLSQVSYGEGYNGSKEPYATTYDPRAVYVVRPGDAAKYSLEESRAYNLKHYVWAGPMVSERYAVIYNYPGHAKPFGAPEKKAAELLDKLKEQPKP